MLRVGTEGGVDPDECDVGGFHGPVQHHRAPTGTTLLPTGPVTGDKKVTYLNRRRDIQTAGVGKKGRPINKGVAVCRVLCAYRVIRIVGDLDNTVTRLGAIRHAWRQTELDARIRTVAANADIVSSVTKKAVQSSAAFLAESTQQIRLAQKNVITGEIDVATQVLALEGIKIQTVGIQKPRGALGSVHSKARLTHNSHLTGQVCQRKDLQPIDLCQ